MTRGFSRLGVPVAKAIGASANVVAAVSLALVALITVAAVVMRAFSKNLPDALDLASIAMGITIFWGFAATFIHDANIRVGATTLFFGPRATRIVRALANSVTFGFVGLMAFAGLDHFETARRSGEVTAQLRIEIWPFLAVALAGLFLAALSAFVAIVVDGRMADLPETVSAE